MSKYETRLSLYEDEGLYRAVDFVVTGPCKSLFTVEGEGDVNGASQVEYGVELRVGSVCCSVGLNSEYRDGQHFALCYNCGNLYPGSVEAPALTVMNSSYRALNGPPVQREDLSETYAWVEEAFQFQGIELDPLTLSIEAGELGDYLVELAWRTERFIAGESEWASEEELHFPWV